VSPQTDLIDHHLGHGQGVAARPGPLRRQLLARLRYLVELEAEQPTMLVDAGQPQLPDSHGVSRSSTTVRAVQIDIDQLVDLAETAALIGIDNPRGVSVYRRRYDDFPAPVIAKGRCVLWRRSDVEAWARQTGRLP
jgi:predicted DNA-binding transcriptional regulator AlpA